MLNKVGVVWRRNPLHMEGFVFDERSWTSLWVEVIPVVWTQSSKGRIPDKEHPSKALVKTHDLLGERRCGQWDRKAWRGNIRRVQAAAALQWMFWNFPALSNSLLSSCVLSAYCVTSLLQHSPAKYWPWATHPTGLSDRKHKETWHANTQCQL